MGGFNPVGTPNTVYYPLGLVTTPQNAFWTQVSNCGVDSTAETDLVTHFQCPTSSLDVTLSAVSVGF